jgi:hypothetical protein
MLPLQPSPIRPQYWPPGTKQLDSGRQLSASNTDPPPSGKVKLVVGPSGLLTVASVGRLFTAPGLEQPRSSMAADAMAMAMAMKAKDWIPLGLGMDVLLR